MSDLVLDNDLWQFACLHYADSALKGPLLRLQDHHHLNINLMLALAWLGNDKKLCSTCHIESLFSKIKAIDSRIIHPLRLVRKKLKHHSTLNAQYQSLKDVELYLEQQQIAELYQLISSMTFERSLTECIRENLSIYGLFSQISLKYLEPCITQLSTRT